jgi:hypothetical protein
MSRPFIDARGLKEAAAYFREFPELANAAARLSVNSSARFASRLASKVIRGQVAFARNYIGAAGAAGSKIRIKKFAQGADLEAIVAAGDRPTSLARFAIGTPSFGKRRKGARGPSVRIKTSGGAQSLKRGFFVKLRRGAVLTDEGFNIGLAVRLKKGESLAASQKASPLGGGAYLLYGPSVAQVFDTSMDRDINPAVADYAAEEFYRQFRRLARG